VSATPLTITFLGTGTSSGVPMIGCDCPVCASADPKDNRLRSSIMVQTAQTSFVIDTTPDFRYQMLRTHTKHVDAIVFTHPHKDHIAGLDDIRALNYVMQRPMHLYANSLTEQAIRKDFYYAFAEQKYPGVPEIEMNTIDEHPFMVGEIQLLPIQVWHLKMPVYGYRFNNITYITDANKIDAAELEKIKGTKILILNALRKEPHISHFTLSEAIDVALQVQAEQVYFTHISHQLGKHGDVTKELPPHMHLAYDGLQLHL
jgi:phosphoribosyl 1,2-cyclic phosphate phosphodiesterase